MKSITLMSAIAILAAGAAHAHGNVEVSDSVAHVSKSKYVSYADPKLAESEAGHLKKTASVDEKIAADRQVTEAAPVEYVSLLKQPAKFCSPVTIKN